MELIFTKILVIHLVKTIIKATYTQYNVLVQPNKPLEWKKILSLDFTICHCYNLNTLGYDRNHCSENIC